MAFVYATLVDLKKHNDKRVLVQLTNDSDTIDPTNESLIDTAILEAAENEAATSINNYLRNVYDNLPLSGASLTSEIVFIASKLAWCNLWERRGDEPEQVTMLRNRLHSRLKAMGKPVADEVREQPRSEKMMPVRSKKGKARTIFDEAGYFDGLSFPGRRTLAGDTENASA